RFVGVPEPAWARTVDRIARTAVVQRLFPRALSDADRRCRGQTCPGACSTVMYAAAGVDITAAEENVRRIGRHVRSTHGPAVLGEFGAFAGLFHLGGRLRDPVLVASTDGVGTKALLGAELGRLDVLGRDLVNLSVNDVLTTGARPLFFVDYVGV